MLPTILLSVVRVLWPEGLNITSYLDVNRFARRTAWAHAFMHDYALWLGPVLVALMFVVAYAVVWWRRNVHGSALLALGGVGTLVALGVNQLVGHAAKELRPYHTYRHALVLVAKANDYSFPSDHAIVAGALLASVLLVLRRGAPADSYRPAFTGRRWSRSENGRVTAAMVVIAVVTGVLSLFLCFARVYVGAHYPGDVVAGLLLGAVIVALASLARPLAYAVADFLDGTALSFLLRRPGEDWEPTFREGSLGGRPAGQATQEGAAEAGR